MPEFECQNCGHIWSPRAQRIGSKSRQQRCSQCKSRNVRIIIPEPFKNPDTFSAEYQKEAAAGSDEHFRSGEAIL